MSETAPPAPGAAVAAADQTAPSAVTKASSYRAELKKWHENAALSDVVERASRPSPKPERLAESHQHGLDPGDDVAHPWVASRIQWRR